MAALLNKRFGKLIVTGYLPRKGWVCLCDCGRTTAVRSNHLKTVRSCGCARYQKGAEAPQWKGHGDISGQFMNSYRGAASERNLPFEVTKEEIWELFLSQGQKCALTGLPLSFRKPRTASLDRKDSRLGYVAGNVQWVHCKVNRLKWDFPEDEFVKWCRLVAEHHAAP